MVDRARRWLFALYVISAVFVAVQQGVLAQSNDFRIYRFSAVNLLAGRDLYAAHPDQHLDFYKYSPTFALLFIPLAVLPFAPALLLWSLLNALYRSWRAIETADTLNRGYSLMQYLYMWFGADWPNWPVQLAGTAVLLLPLALGRRCCADAAFRRLFLCSLLVYMVLFNHQSEHATFIIAVTGIAIWYVSSPPSQLRTAIMA